MKKQERITCVRCGKQQAASRIAYGRSIAEPGVAQPICDSEAQCFRREKLRIRNKFRRTP